MTTVGGLKENLRALLKRGNSLDAQLPWAMRKAANWIEQNYSLEYMKKRFVLTLASGQSEVDLPNIRIKSLLRFGWRLNGMYVPVAKKDFDDFTPVGVVTDGKNYDGFPRGDGVPGEYTISGGSTLLFSLPATQDLTGEGYCIRYSDWPKDDNATHWLLLNAESLMEVQCMLEMAVFNRDDRSYQIFKLMRDEQIQVLQNANYEARYSGQEIVLGQE